MRNQNFLFITFCLILVTGLLQSYALFQDYFSPHKEDQKKISLLQKQLEKEKLQRILAQNQVLDYQQEVAAQLPQLDQLNKDSTTFSLRSIASVSQAPIQGFELSGSLMEKAKAGFRDKKYDKAVSGFQEVINKYPTSPLIIESYFLMGESYFVSGKYQECLDVVDTMMSHFPENEWTGFMMLRMGQILQKRGRSDEASEVYVNVAEKFSFNQELRNQAYQLKKSLE